MVMSFVLATTAAGLGGHGVADARLHNGPVRYSRYKLIVFVLTSDGVRRIQRVVMARQLLV
jgi:hypothetical protein